MIYFDSVVMFLRRICKAQLKALGLNWAYSSLPQLTGMQT